MKFGELLTEGRGLSMTLITMISQIKGLKSNNQYIKKEKPNAYKDIQKMLNELEETLTRIKDV